MELVTDPDNLSDSLAPHHEFGAAFSHLQNILLAYLERHPNITVGGMSKRCAVSEPTLRRIKSGQVKTLPSVTTVVEILTYISKETSTQGLLNAFPGPIADYLSSKLGQIEQVKELQYSEKLTRTLTDPVKYLVYKLASMSAGVGLEKIVELFGSYGENQLLKLAQEDLVALNTQGFYIAKIQDFALSNEVFVEHFKSTADFIKPHKHATAAKAYSPIFSNFSNSISKKAYGEILKTQRAANKKIIAILCDKNSEGNIPTFVLNAVDTLDTSCADEFVDELN